MVALGLVLVLASFAPMGCAGPKAYGSLAVRAVTDDPVELKCTFTEAWFRPADAGTSFYLSDVPLDTLLSGRPGAGQIMHIELM